MAVHLTRENTSVSQVYDKKKSLREEYIQYFSIGMDILLYYVENYRILRGSDLIPLTESDPRTKIW